MSSRGRSGEGDRRASAEAEGRGSGDGSGDEVDPLEGPVEVDLYEGSVRLAQVERMRPLRRGFFIVAASEGRRMFSSSKLGHCRKMVAKALRYGIA